MAGKTVAGYRWKFQQKRAPLSRDPFSVGAFNRNRTDDLILTMDALYRLSYKGMCSMERMTGIEPAWSAWEAGVLPLNYIRVFGDAR